MPPKNKKSQVHKKESKPEKTKASDKQEKKEKDNKKKRTEKDPIEEEKVPELGKRKRSSTRKSNEDKFSIVTDTNSTPSKKLSLLLNINAFPTNMQLIKKDGEKTLKQIIEDTKSGIPAKSELVQKEKKAFLKKQNKKRDEKAEIKSLNPSQVSHSKHPGSQISIQDSQLSSSVKDKVDINSQLNSAPQGQTNNFPQLIMKDGQIVVVPPAFNPMNKQQTLALAHADKEVTVINSSNQKLSSVSFMKRQPAEKWKPEETEKFYLALQIFGTDFSLIEKIFGSRSREQIKNKFRKEERKNKLHIDKLLLNKEGLTLKDFEEKYGKVHIEEMQPMSDIEDSSSEGEDEVEEEKQDDSNSKFQDDDSNDQSQFGDSSSKSVNDQSNQNSTSILPFNKNKFNFMSHSPFKKPQPHNFLNQSPIGGSAQKLSQNGTPSNGSAFKNKFTINTF